MFRVQSYVELGCVSGVEFRGPWVCLIGFA